VVTRRGSADRRFCGLRLSERSQQDSRSGIAERWQVKRRGPQKRWSALPLEPLHHSSRNVAWPIRLLICELKLVISPNVESRELLSGC
jgi:hypothetical protein